MLGVIFIERGRAILRTEPTPKAGPGQVLCHTLYSGVSNGTERSCLVGGNYGGRWPARVAYQHVAQVEDVGAGVTQFHTGDLVFAGNLGGHVEYFVEEVLPDNDDNNLLIHLPAGIPLSDAALLGITAVSVHNVAAADARSGQRALIMGAGPIGQIIAQLLTAAGITTIICDTHKERLRGAYTCGLQNAVDDWASVDHFAPFDVVFETTGADVLSHIIGEGWGDGILQSGGRLVLTGGRTHVEYHFNAAQGKELQLLHVNHFTRGDLRLALQLLITGAVQLRPLIREVLPISEAPSFYDRLRDDPGSTLGTIFQWPTHNREVPQRL